MAFVEESHLALKFPVLPCKTSNVAPHLALSRKVDKMKPCAHHNPSARQLSTYFTHLAVLDARPLHNHRPAAQNTVLNVAAVSNCHTVLQDTVQHLGAHPQPGSANGNQNTQVSACNWARLDPWTAPLDLVNGFV